MSASRTARMAAAYRARASARVAAVCSDPWAQHLVEEDAVELLRRGDAVVPEMELGVALRTAWLDERVRATAAPQIAILGAGLDTRAARLARSGVRFFEVDHAATQGHKRAMLGRVPGYPGDAATMVPVDLERDEFIPALVAAGFKPEEPSLVLWEGVTPYLTEAAIRKTLRALGSPEMGRASVLFDYVAPARIDGVSRVAAEVGEPFIFMTDDIAPLAREAGFDRVEVTSMVDECVRRTGVRAENSPFFDRWFLAHLPDRADRRPNASDAPRSRDRARMDPALATIAAHCDIVDRLTVIPPSAQVRGVYIRSIDTQLAHYGKLEAYRDLFRDDAYTAMGLYPLGDYLVRLACAGALVCSPARVHEGMFVISKGNATEFVTSLLGRLMLKDLSRDPVRLTEQGVAARRQSFTYGHWEIRQRGERFVEVLHQDEYRWLESAVAGAAKGMVEACGIEAEVESKPIDRFNGSTFIRW